jgi:hypothetical protein
VSEQPPELLGSRNMLDEGTRISMFGKRNQKFVDILRYAEMWAEMNPNPMDDGYLLACLK